MHTSDEINSTYLLCEVEEEAMFALGKCPRHAPDKQIHINHCHEIWSLGGEVLPLRVKKESMLSLRELTYNYGGFLKSSGKLSLH